MEYGQALYELCAEEHIDAPVLSELRSLKTIFKENPDFLRLLGNMSLSKEERCGILDKTLRGQVQPYVLNFLKLLCDRGGMHEFAGCEEAYRTAWNKANGVVEATVTTAKPLSDSQREALRARLVEMNGGKAVEITEAIDEKVLGGVVVEMNGRRWDNTVQRRLADIRRRMAGEA